MAPHQRYLALRPLSDLTNLTRSTCSRPCSSIGSSLPQIHDEVVESQDRRKARGKGKGKAAMAEYGYISQSIGKLKQTNRRKAQKSSPYVPRSSLSPLSPRIAKEESSWNFTPPQDYIEKQRAYFAEIDAFELDEEEVSESELD